MSHIFYTDQQTIVPAAWLNDVDTVAYTYFGNGTSLTGNLKVPGNGSVGNNIPGGTGARTWWIDNNGGAGNITRFRSLGQDAATFGTYGFEVAKSDNSGITQILGITNGGIQVTGRVNISSVGGAGSDSLNVGSSDTLQHSIRIYGDLSADKAPIISMFRTGNTEGFIAQSSTGLIFGTTNGLANYNDSTLNSAQTLKVTSTGIVSPIVVTPLVGTATDVVLAFQTNNASRWEIEGSANNYDLWPTFADNGQSIGRPGGRVKQVFTPIIDSGTTGSLSLRTNNGQTGLAVRNLANSVNWVQILPAAAGGAVAVQCTGNDNNIGLQLMSAGTGSVGLMTNGGNTQFEVLHTANNTRWATITGSNGGNPTISTTAGSLAVTPTTIFGANIGVHGTSPSDQNGGIQFPATQSASSDANNLDDYAENTWTPTLGGSATYTVQSGSYTKIGRLVFFDCNLTVNVIGTGSTSSITGLPFNAANTSQFAIRINGSVTAIVSATVNMTAGGAALTIVSRTAANANDAVNAIFQNGTSVVITGCYRI